MKALLCGEKNRLYRALVASGGKGVQGVEEVQRMPGNKLPRLCLLTKKRRQAIWEHQRRNEAGWAENLARKRSLFLLLAPCRSVRSTEPTVSGGSAR